MTISTSSRLGEIDGIRGWAALIVVLFHCFGEMLKNVVPVVNISLLSPLFAGDYAVLIFFVLSGDALSSSFFSSKSVASIDRLIVRRYFRLTIPIFMSCLFTYFIIVLGFDFHRQAAVILNREDWLGEFLKFNASLFNLFKYSLMNVYTTHTREQSFNPFLWTMSIEMVGSMLVFLYCYVWDKLKRPALICVVVASYMLVTGSFYSLFFGGIYLGYLRENGTLKRLTVSNPYQLCSALFLLALIALKVFHPFDAGSNIVKPLIYLSAIAFVLCLYISKPVVYFMRGSISTFMGEISFPLYLVHFQIIISLMSWLITRKTSGEFNATEYLIISGVAVLVSIFVAFIFRYFEKRILKFVDPYILNTLER